MIKQFFIELSHEERIRVRLKINKGRIGDLVVQLETWKERWIPVARYDYAHGIPHLDLLYANGTKEKRWIEGRSLESVVNAAIDDLKANWQSYLLRCGYEE